jgi:hypothetical protein
MWGREDNQEVGLEAAILERVRNSSLVKWSCADNVAGLKRTAEAVATSCPSDRFHRSLVGVWGVLGGGRWVGERSASGEALE